MKREHYRLDSEIWFGIKALPPLPLSVYLVCIYIHIYKHKVNIDCMLRFEKIPERSWSVFFFFCWFLLLDLEKTILVVKPRFRIFIFDGHTLPFLNSLRTYFVVNFWVFPINASRRSRLNSVFIYTAGKWKFTEATF